MDASILIEGGIGAAFVVAIVEALKSAGMRSKYGPISSLIVGIALAALYGFFSGYDVVMTILLAAIFSGVGTLSYDGYRQVRENISIDQEQLSLERRLKHIEKKKGNA